MKELMARGNGNQDVYGHERRTSRFIIRISDRIDLICVSCVSRDKVMVTLWLWICYSCLSLIIVWWAFINNKHKLSKLNNDFIFKWHYKSHTLWLSTCESFILMKCVVARCLIFQQYESCFVWRNDSNSVIWRVRLIGEIIWMILA
jgi:hypothetical protein